MKKYTVYIEKKTKVFDTIEVQASCPMEAKRIARAVAHAQDRDIFNESQVEFEGKKYPKFAWSESEKPSYATEIIK